MSAESAVRVLGRPVNPPRWARLPIGVCCGALMALGLAPFDLWYVSLIGLTAAFLLYQASPTRKRAAGSGWAIGLGYFSTALMWIVEPFMIDAAATGWMAPFALVLMAGGLALFWGLAFWSAASFKLRPLWQLALFWGAAEMLRGYVLTGFPWAMIGYIWSSVNTIQWVSVFGPYGLTFATCLFAACVAKVLQEYKFGLRLSLTTGFLAALLGGGAQLVPPAPDLADRPIVRLIQPNATQDQKWLPDMMPIFFRRQVEYTGAEWQQDAEPSLIVWPETALPMLLGHASDAFNIISEAAGPAPVVVGIQREEQGAYFNSLAVMDGQGELVDVYDKHHLVPFGEYMPGAWLFSYFNILGLAARADGAYTPGPGPKVLDLGDLGLALPLICYEVVFPQDVYRSPERPSMLLQLTNDAWFGSWAGPQQHLAQARIRAIEQGLPLIRVANTGVSAMIDGGGRIIGQLPLNEAGYLDAPLPLPARLTYYAQTGDFPVIFMFFSLFLVIIVREKCPKLLTLRRLRSS